MASGMSLVMRYMSFNYAKDRPAKDRDRSLRGKARVRARKAANKERKRNA
jgi:hypothetical protein